MLIQQGVIALQWIPLIGICFLKVLHSFLTIHVICLPAISGVLVIYTRLVGLSSLLFDLTLSNEHYKCFTQMLALLVTLIPIMTSPS
jgi:hypothetical protein